MSTTRTPARRRSAGKDRSRPPSGRAPLHPRIRARRVAVTRARGRRRLRVLVVLGVVLGALALVLAVLYSGLFSARHLSVRGSVHTTSAAVLGAAGLTSHPPLIDVDPGAAAARVEQLPWVAGAVVGVHWPDTVTVTVTERVPAAVVSRPGGVALVDVHGRVLTWTRSAPAGLVDLGAPGAVGPPGTVLGGAARPGLDLVGALPVALAARVGAVHVGARGDLSLELGKGVGAEIGQDVNLGAKLEALASVLAGAPPKGPAWIDVSVPDEPTVGPPPAGGQPPP
jgi:cell division protein FtsQ